MVDREVSVEKEILKQQVGAGEEGNNVTIQEK
jgi:hypothetical protein